MEELILQANQKLFERDYAAALPLYKQIVHEDPESSRGYVGLAACYSALNLFDQALTNVDRAIRLDSSSANPYYVLSYIALRKGETKNLFNYAEKAYLLAPDSPNSLLYFGPANFLNENPEKGIEILEKGKKLSPDFFEIRQSLYMSKITKLIPSLLTLLILITSASCKGNDGIHITPSRPSPTKPIDHSTPTPISQIAKTSSPPEKFERLPVILFQDIGGVFYVENAQTGTIKQISPENSWWKWGGRSGRDCHFSISNVFGDVYLVDLNGKKVDKLFDYKIFSENGWSSFDQTILLNPNGKMFWFFGEASGKPSNERGDNVHMEIQNLMTMSTDLTEGPYKISDYGGAWSGAWSPSGNLLAYSDFDQSHVHQVYISTVNGDKKWQVTKFTEKNNFDDPLSGISDFRWSPDEMRLAVNFYKNQRIHAAVFSINNEENSKGIELLDGRILWWIDDTHVIFRGKTTGKNGQESIFVLDLENNQYSSPLTNEQILTGPSVFQFGKPNLAGYFTATGFYVYDMEKNKTINYQQVKNVSNPILVEAFSHNPNELGCAD